MYLILEFWTNLVYELDDREKQKHGVVFKIR